MNEKETEEKVNKKSLQKLCGQQGHKFPKRNETKYVVIKYACNHPHGTKQKGRASAVIKKMHVFCKNCGIKTRIPKSNWGDYVGK